MHELAQTQKRIHIIVVLEIWTWTNVPKTEAGLDYNNTGKLYWVFWRAKCRLWKVEKVISEENQYVSQFAKQGPSLVKSDTADWSVRMNGVVAVMEINSITAQLMAKVSYSTVCLS